MGSAKTDPFLGVVVHMLISALHSGEVEEGARSSPRPPWSTLRFASQPELGSQTDHKQTQSTSVYHRPAKLRRIQRSLHSFVLEKHREREPAFPSCASPRPPHPDHLWWQEKAQHKGGQGVRAGGGVARNDRGRGPDLHVLVSEACSLCSGQR